MVHPRRGREARAGVRSTGSASPDYYGGERPGDNRWANSVVALKAATGELVWGFQVVHHDLWDFDVASQPTLIEFRGKAAVAVNTKMGTSSCSTARLASRSRPWRNAPCRKADMPGEDAAPSQPIPTWSSLVPQKLTAADAWGPTPEMRKWCQEKNGHASQRRLVHAAHSARHHFVSGNVGGVNWGSAAWIRNATSYWPIPIVWLQSLN